MLACCTGRCHELEFTVGKDSCREVFHKVENTCGSSLVLTESLIVHKEVHNLAVAGLEPGHELVGCERPVLPAFVGETECDIVAQTGIAEKEFLVLLRGCLVKIVRTLPTENVLCTFSEDGLESEVSNHIGNGVGIDELSVAESGRSDTEILLDGFLVLCNLVLEF